MSKICPKFQVISFYFFEVDELLDEQWAKIVQSENISTPIYVECDKMYRPKVCVQEFSYFVFGLDIQLEKPEYYSPVSKKMVAVAKYDESDTVISLLLIWINGLVVKTGWWVLNSSAAPQPFCVALSPSVHWHNCFLYCCTLYNFFFLGFRQWQSHADRVVTPSN